MHVLYSKPFLSMVDKRLIMNIRRKKTQNQALNQFHAYTFTIQARVSIMNWEWQAKFELEVLWTSLYSVQIQLNFGIFLTQIVMNFAKLAIHARSVQNRKSFSKNSNLLLVFNIRL